MSSLAIRRFVRPAGGIIANYLRARSRAAITRSAFNMARTLRPHAMKYGARTIQAVWRGYRQRKQSNRSRIGTPVGRGTARHTQTGQVSPTGNQANRSLFVRNITDIQQGTNPNQRNRDIVNFRGVKICCDFMNVGVNVDIFVNYALVSPKAGITVDLERFFRSNAAERAIDFDDQGLTAMDYHCRAINADIYNIITHKRLRLARQSAEVQNGNFTYSRRVMRYVPIKRQLRYQDLGGGLGEECTTPIFFIWWYDVEGNAAGENAIEPVDVLKTDLRLITYFRNPPN